ncbi:polysaccharide deacetylase [Sphingomonas sp. HMWF008]|nr:polysaccharide deacetylase [Sphingomonas sp. HMWF008]
MTPLRQMMFVAGLVLVALSLAAAVDPGEVAPAAVPLAEPVAVGKRIALTFDDVPRGPGAFYTPAERTTRLITALRDSGVSQAAFFANPGRIGARSDGTARLAAYAAAGHVIADHSWSHRDLRAMPTAAFLADIDKAEAFLKGRSTYRPWFRFPGLNQGGRDGMKRRAVVDGLAARRLQIAWVTVDGSDWNIEGQTIAAKKAGKPIDDAALRDLYVETMVQSADFSDALMLRIAGRAVPHVMLLHETDIAARYIGDLIAALRRDGWTIVTADEAYADPIYDQKGDFDSANGTLPEALAWQRRLPGPLYYERNDIALANRLFAERVLHAPTGAIAAR